MTRLGTDRPVSTMQRTPFKDLEEMLDRVGRQLEHTRMGVGGEIPTAAVDVGEWDGEFVVEADLPGFADEDVDVRVTDNTLHVEAEHKAEREEREELTYLRKERAKTDVSRTIHLPEAVDTERTAATYENGVLTVTLPKKHEEEAETGHEIEIQ